MSHSSKLSAHYLELAKASVSEENFAGEDVRFSSETVELKLSVEEGSRYVGVLAAYRDLPETKWRYTVQITPVQVTAADLTLDQAGIRNTHEMFAKTDD